MIKKIIILFLHLAFLFECRADYFKAQLVSVKDGIIAIDLENISTEFVVINRGNKDNALHYGIGYVSSEGGAFRIKTIGSISDITQNHGFLLLPPGYSQRFEVKVEDVNDIAAIRHMRVRLSFLVYSEFSARIERPKQMLWNDFSRDIVFKAEAILRGKTAYEFGLGIGGSEQSLIESGIKK